MVAAHLLQVEPHLLDERAGRELEAAHQLVRHDRPRAVLLDEVSAHLEVLDHMTARAASAQRTKKILREYREDF